MASGDAVQVLGGDRLEAADREERDVGDTGLGADVDEGIVVAAGQVVEVLDAGDRRDLTCLGELLGGDVGDAQMPDQPLLAQRQKGRQRPGQGRPGPLQIPHPQIHQIQTVHAEREQVGLDSPAQIVGRQAGLRRVGQRDVGPLDQAPTFVAITRPSG